MSGDDTLKVQEHHLVLEADPHRMKVIAEAIAEYVYKYNLEDDTTLNDFRYAMETEYQQYYGLEEDDFDFVTEIKE